MNGPDKPITVDWRGYAEQLGSILLWARCEMAGREHEAHVGMAAVMDELREARLHRSRVYLAGNGGSAATAAHIAVDLAKFCRVKAWPLTEPTALTCIGNDYGFESIFAKQIEWQAEHGELVILLSCSGTSPNILRAAGQALVQKCRLVTFSGFAKDNPLRKMGAVNFHVGWKHYGFVQLAHEAILHGIVDLMAPATGAA